MLSTTKKAVISVVMALSCSVPIWAQIAGGSIVGNVLDPSSAAIAGASVTATNVDSNQPFGTKTNDVGYYEFPLLPTGRYVVEVQQAGFQNAKTAELFLHAGTQPKIDFHLTLATVAQKVEVSARAPLVNSTTTEVGTVVDNSKVDAMPLNGRSFRQLLDLEAGVVNNPVSSVGGRGGLEVQGSPAFGNNMLLDGVDMSFGENNAVASDAGAGGGGYLITTVSIDAIQEFKVTAGAYSAEYGRATGSVVNLTSKSGTNKFHGRLFEFLRNDKLDANSFFNNASGLPKSALRWNQFGGNIGGPIRRDRVFFFFNYEGAVVHSPAYASGNVPSPLLLSLLTPPLQSYFKAGIPTNGVSTPTANPYLLFARRNDTNRDTEHTTLSRADARLTNNQQLSVRFNYNHQDYSTPYGGTIIRPDNRFLYPMRFHNAALEHVWTISPTRVNELRIGYNRPDLDRANTSYDTQPAYAEVASAGLWDYLSRLHFLSNVLSLDDNFTLVHGAQTWKFGAQIRDLRSTRVQAKKPGSEYNTLDDLIADSPYEVYAVFGNPGRGQRTTSYSGYAQDDWRVSRRLQVNAGLRYDYFTPLTGPFNVVGSDPFGPFAPKGTPVYAPDRNNLGPRLGLIYDVFGNQKTILRAGGGISYIGPQPFFHFDMSYIDPRIPFNAYLHAADLPAGMTLAFPFPQSYVMQIANNPSLLPAGLILGRGIANHNGRTEYSERYNFTIQQAITSTLAVQASYVGDRALKLWSTRPVNLYDPALGQRPHPEIGDIVFRENAGRSWYNALELQANQRLAKGLSFDLYYTWSHTMSYYQSDQVQADNPGLQDPNNIAGSTGPKDGEMQHKIVAVYSYNLPTPGFAAHSAFGRALLGGWVTQGIPSWHSGVPVNILAGVDLVGNSDPEGTRPDIVPGVPVYLHTSDRLAYFNPAAFTNAVPLSEHRYGDIGYNTVRAPSAFGWDASLHKTFKIHERQELVFRWELFSLLNHTVLGGPVNTVTDPNFGRITGAGGNRDMQLALKYIF